jgi:hypothetical protein
VERRDGGRAGRAERLTGFGATANGGMMLKTS